MASIFTQIVNGEIPCYKIAETHDFLAFLDAFPLVEGHTLVIPKKEVDKIWDLDPETYKGLMEFAHKIAVAVEKAIPCKRVGMSVIGLEVPHTHVHLVPLNQMNDINFSREKIKITPEKMTEIADKIKDCLSGG